MPSHAALPALTRNLSYPYNGVCLRLLIKAGVTIIYVVSSVSSSYLLAGPYCMPIRPYIPVCAHSSSCERHIAMFVYHSTVSPPQPHLFEQIPSGTRVFIIKLIILGFSRRGFFWGGLTEPYRTVRFCIQQKTVPYRTV